MKKGFTLVELMVVIAIIAILAVGSITSYNSYIEKARFSNALQFSKNVYSKLYVSAKTIYQFNEGSGLTTRSDGLDYTVNGTLQNGVTWGEDILLNSSNSYSPIFNGSNYISLPRSNITEPTKTISFWIETDTEITPTSTGEAVMSFYHPSSSAGGTAVWLGSSTGYCANETIGIQGGSADPTGRICGYKNIKEGKNHILITWNDSEYKIYINGEEIPTNDGAGSILQLNNQDLRTIGSRQVWGSIDGFFSGKIDEIAIFRDSFLDN